MTRFSAGFAELVLIVEDVPRAARFYRDVLRLAPESDATEDWAWFWAGEPGSAQRLAVHRGTLLFEEHSPHPPGERWGQVHFALSVEPERLDAALAHVRAQGVTLFGPQRFDWMGATAYYLYDPDGNLVELWSPDPP